MRNSQIHSLIEDLLLIKREEIFNELSKRQAKSPTINYGDVVTMSDENETRQQHMTEALLHRADPGRNKMTDGGRRFAGLRLFDFAKKRLKLVAKNGRHVPDVDC